MIAEIQMSDIITGDWTDRHAPAALRPYIRLARLDRPTGIWLLLFPCWWSIAMAAKIWSDWWLMILFAIGAVAMRGAGCTLNDLIDRKIDAGVARTRNRPLPSGAVTPFQAILFMAAQLAIGAAVLFALNGLSIVLGFAVLVLVATYPLMKRITYWPQLFLGFNFNWGALMGWAAVTGRLAPAPCLLYFGGIAWTLFYDTIYAHQDREDDMRMDVKSSALALGKNTRIGLFGFATAALVLWAAAGASAGLAWPFYLSLFLVGVHLTWQAARLNTNDPAVCLQLFRANRLIGWLLLLGIVAARVTGSG